MISARLFSFDRVADVQLALCRTGTSAEQAAQLASRIAHRQILLTELSQDARAFLSSKNLPGGIAVTWGKLFDVAVLSGTQEQLLQLMQAEAPPALVQAISSTLRTLETPSPLKLLDRKLHFGVRTHLMGVVNVTPDSFSDGGRFIDPEAAVAHGLQLAEAGADVLDVGGESTRPGAVQVSADEELSRVLPVIRRLKERTQIPISVDTYKSEVAQEALRAGACMVNDVSGFHWDHRLPKVVAQANASCCLMHLQGTPQTMQKDPAYQDLLPEVLNYLGEGIQAGEQEGIPKDRILVDPGIGFGKTAGHNLFLLKQLVELRSLGCAVLVGPSRKSFIGALTGKTAEDRLFGTLGSVAAAAVLGGADMVRVHDVKEAKDALAVADAIRIAREAGSRYQQWLGSAGPQGQV